MTVVMFFKQSRLPAHISNFLDTTSSHVIFHFAQLINTGRFAQFDYGVLANLIHYKTEISPDYPIHRIKTKHIYLFEGMNDYLGDPTDINILVNKVPGYFNNIH